MRQAAVAAVPAVFASGVAQAHVVIDGVGGFAGGLLHPLLVPAHTLTLIALGLAASALPIPDRLRLLFVSGLAAVAAFALLALAYSATRAELSVLCLGAAIALLLAAGLKPSFPVTALFAAAIAGAVIFDSVPAVLTVRETALALAGTILAATALVAATAWLVAALPQSVGPIAVRIAASWIAASAIMVLALRLSA
ncbi:MAG: HupE/UreJ family protein [Pseudorhodoplanes sp.]|uniref:HupE/UreJ family protein n=1 Tax=Pseudorhodoplanes sp. TaxID=1934341 RepID=UPI003D0E987F